MGLGHRLDATLRRRRFAARNVLPAWLLERTVPMLILLFLIGHVALIAAFAIAYYIAGAVVDSSGGQQSGVADLLYFSSTTQTTLGYGDLSPQGWARLFSQIQTAFGVVFNALFLGLVVAKVLRSRGPIQFHSQVAYNPDKHRFQFWYWNRSPSTVFDTRRTLTIMRGVEPTTTSNTRIRNVRAALDRSDSPRMRGMTTVYARSVPATNPLIETDLEGTADGEGSALRLLDLKPADKIVFVVSGVDELSRTPVFGLKEYEFKDLFCGTFPHVFENDHGTIEPPLKQRRYDRFQETVPTTRETCRACDLHKVCRLELAENVRANDAEE